ncbi:MAG: cysteine desulfurase family protein [Corynebacterium sp.]|nr:cysteine desulfurase family protein [Corynebacterium sp.]
MYLDYAATSPMRQVAIDAWTEHAHFLNPAGQYALGRDARRALETARETIAGLLGAEPIEVIFTASGTEADNMAILGLNARTEAASLPIIASPIEHPAVRESLTQVAGTTIEYLKTDASRVLIDATLDAPARFATLMWANNETGAIQPVEEFVARASAVGTPTHIDAVQVVGHLPVNFDALGASTLAASAHKFGGPRGFGFLLAKRTAPLAPIFHGGGQERRLRPGTVDVAGAAAAAAALEESVAQAEQENARIAALRDKLRAGIEATVPNILIHTPPADSELGALPGHLYVSFCGAEGDSLIMLFDTKGIACSTGSACSSGVNRASEVLIAQGVSEKDARSAIRFSLGRENTEAEIDELLAFIPEAVERARLAGMA